MSIRPREGRISPAHHPEVRPPVYHRTTDRAFSTPELESTGIRWCQTKALHPTRWKSLRESSINAYVSVRSEPEMRLTDPSVP